MKRFMQTRFIQFRALLKLFCLLGQMFHLIFRLGTVWNIVGQPGESVKEFEERAMQTPLWPEVQRVMRDEWHLAQFELLCPRRELAFRNIEQICQRQGAAVALERTRELHQMMIREFINS